ncbi:MAG: Ig-like domain-containing protein, partial [Actinomycetes bacterium]
MQRLFLTFVALVLGLVGVLATPGSALAAPLPAAYSGAAGGDVLAFDLDVVGGVELADARLLVSQSDVDSTADPEVTATAGNLAAEVAGLGLTVQSTTQTAPPNNDAPETDTIAAATVPGLLSLGVVNTRAEAHYTTDQACVPGGLLADSLVESDGSSLAPAGLGTIVETGDASTRGVVDLVPSPADDPLNRAVRSVATGTLSETSFLDGAVLVAIDGESSLTAIATGEPGGASVRYVPGTVTVTVGDRTETVPLGESETFTVPGGEVVITVNEPTVTQSADGQTATGEVAVVTAEVRVGPEALPLATATVDLLPLRATAVAPEGGIDCPPPAPVLIDPADGLETTDTTPTFTGTAVAGAEVEIFVDGTSLGTTIAEEDGTFSFTPDTPLQVGSYTATATQTTV